MMFARDSLFRGCARNSCGGRQKEEAEGRQGLVVCYHFQTFFPSLQ
jgi:hypothetical protein